MIILDTNVLSALMRPSLNRSVVAWLDGQPRISIWTTAISVMEVRFGLSIVAAGRQRRLQEAEFERVIADDLQNRILSFDAGAAEQTGMLMATRRLAGRPRDLRDSMVAGIAVAHRATIATRNVRHFDDIDISIIDPWQS